ncbi:MAG TPA: AAA family ATPase [Blastocatellia bacterium]|nr:AAA family ATPase [Blastocatellia bacterium]
MYTEFYGLRELPFGLTPNPKYIFKTESYLEVISNLKYGITHYKGIVMVTGEVGTGKTTTLRSMMQQLGHKIASVYILNPSLTVPEFFEVLCTSLQLGLSPSASKPEILSTLARSLAARHSKGMRTVLIADEAHGLTTAVLEEIRLLANLETNTEKLIQIILCGQPELREKLNQPNLRQLKQRISLRCSIKPLALFEVPKYIRFRLKTAGAERVDLFDSQAVELIGQASGGIPRVINNICDNALLEGYADGRETISRDVIENVLERLDIAPTDVGTVEPNDFGTWTAPLEKEFAVPENSHN